MRKLLSIIVLSILFCSAVGAQIVTTTPVVTEEGSIEVIFDASKGTAGLKAYTGDVYAHTGVITSKSTSGTDWKYTKAEWNVNIPACKMTSLGNDKWKLVISPNIRGYYGITDASEKIKQLAFVFRSSDGKKEGKDTGGKDIYVDVYQAGLTVIFASPASETNIIEVGKSISFTIQSTQNTWIECFVNKTSVAQVENATELKFDYTFSATGNYEVVAVAGSGDNVSRDTVQVISRPAVINESRPPGVKAGINIVNNSVVTLCLYAPYKNFVYLVGDFNDWKINNDYFMKKDGDYWWLPLSSLQSGQEYAYQYLVNGDLRIADPYTDKVLDPWKDSEIPSSVYPDLKPYPAGKTSGIVSVFQTGQQAYDWKINNFQPVDKKNLLVYELLTRDFTEEHSFQACIQKLDYLKLLGVNAVELMPVNEFEGNDSWGYNPSFYFAVDKYYGTKNDLKALVDACHERGMAVIMDMVLNHSYGQCPFVQLYWNTQTNAPDGNSPWYNVSSPNPVFNWGYDFNHEKPQTQALVDSINSYWMSEYKIDGFRFDFTKGFTQKPGDGMAYDASRIAILKRMRDEIRKRKSNAIVIFEHLSETSEEVELADDDILLWGNMNNQYCQSGMGYSEGSDLSNAVYKKRGFNQPNLLAYMESHDEERMMYKNKEYGNASGTYNVKDMSVALQRASLSACFYFLIPGPKMIWQFGELGYDYSINYCMTNGTVNDACRTSPKPVRWDYFSDSQRKELYNRYATLIQLKHKYAAFSTTDFSYYLNGFVKSFIWKHNEMNAFAVGNFDVSAENVNISVPKSGKWYEVFSGNEIDLSTTIFTAMLQPGEYRLYTDKKIDPSTGIQDISNAKSQALIYPNPATTELIIDNGQLIIDSLTITDINGRMYHQVKPNVVEYHLSVIDWPKGVYLLKLNNEVLKFIKN